MKAEKATIPFYTTILATLLKEWREQNHISIYAIAKNNKCQSAHHYPI